MVFSYSYVSTNPSRSSRLSCQSVSTGVFLFKWIRSFQHPQDQLKSSQRCSFHPFPRCLFFPAFPPFLFKDLEIFKSSIRLSMGSLFILFRQYPYPVILRKILKEASSSSFFVLFLLWWIQCKLSVLIISFSLVHMLSMLEVLTKDSLNLSLLAIELFRSAEDISKIRVSTLLSFKLFRGCYLIQAI